MNIIFDFDSTLITKDAFDDIVLELHSYNNQKNKRKIYKISKDFQLKVIESEWEKIIELVKLKREDINLVSKRCIKLITKGMAKLIKELKENNNIFIVTAGFKKIILPTAKKLGIKEENCYGNEFIFTGDYVTGVKESPLIRLDGKSVLIKKLKEDGILKGKTIMVGDGWNDLETYLQNAVDLHICFTGVLENKKVIEKSKYVAKNTNEIKQIIEKVFNTKI